MNILIADDNEDSRLLLQAMLESEGFTTVLATNGEDALQMARHWKPDVIISDILMPKMDGFALCRAVKRDPALRHIPFVFYTASYTDPKSEELAQALGASRFIIKPLETPQFLAMIDEVLRECEAHSVPVPAGAQRDEREIEQLYRESLARKLDEKLGELEHERKALIESEQRYRAVVDTAADAILTIDEHSQICFANPAVEAVFGYRPEELIGGSLTQLMTPPDRTRHLDGLQRYLASGERRIEWSAVSVQGLRKDGRQVPLEISYGEYRGEQGQRLFTGIVRDVSEREQAQERLLATEERMDMALQAAGVGTWSWSVADNVVVWDRHVAPLFGLEQGEFDGTVEGFIALLHPDERARAERLIRATLEHDAPYDTEYQALWPDGSVHTVACRGKVYRDGDGRPVRMTGVSLDVTPRRQAQEQLRQAATVFESTSEAVLITDRDNKILAVNKAFTDITGYGQAEVLGKTPGILRSGRHDEAFYVDMWVAIERVGHWRGEVWNRRKSGELFPGWLTISVVRDEAGRTTNYVGVFSDITEIKHSQAQIEHLAHHDALTDLPNRLLFNARLSHGMRSAHRKGTQLAVLFLDLDRFKNINDTLGHPAGDELLKAVALRLSGSLREDDTVARLGGDEFIVLMEDLHDSGDAALVAQKIIDACAAPFAVAGREVVITPSIGISIYPQDGETVNELVSNADAAMYRAKEEGKNTYQYYTKELTATAFERLMIESSLRRALERDEFVLLYQPQISTKTGRVVCIEALLRWRHADLGMLSPTKFVPLAAETGLIVPIGAWVLRSACAQARAWQDAGLPPLKVAVNICTQQLGQGELLATVREALRESALEPACLELEITEGFIMRQPEEAIALLRRLKEIGVSLAIDDFGTGYSSLSYLKRLPIDKLKIDQSFVRGIPEDPNDQAIARAVIALGHSLKLAVTAEGVESDAQLEFVRNQNCDAYQGFLFSRPLPATQLAELLATTAAAFGTAAIDPGSARH